MPAVIGAVLAIALYGAACYYVFVYVLGPAWPFVTVGAGGIGMLLVIVVLAGVLLGLGGSAAPTVTPFDLRKRLPSVKSNFERDSAWPSYLFAQSRADLGAALGRTARTLGSMWALMTEVVREKPVVLVLWPLLLLPLLGAIALTAGAIVGCIAVYGLVGIVLTLAWLGWLLIVLVTNRKCKQNSCSLIAIA